MALTKKTFDNMLLKALLVVGLFSTAHGTVPKSKECTIIVQSALHIDDSIEDITFECILDPIDANEQENLSVPILLTDVQQEILQTKFESGELVSALSTLKFEQDIQVSNEGILIPSNKNTFAFGKINIDGNDSRRLAVLEGDKPILVVKVVDSDGKALNESTDTISNDIFGPTDTMTLKSQMEACSFDKLKILPGVGSANEKANGNGDGVIEVTIDRSLVGNSLSVIRNAVNKKVEEVLGISLPGPYHHVMFLLEGCHDTDCGWAAYAFVNSWLSVYQGGFYKMVGVQMHELGHNFNLAHSGGLDGKTYTDHTGLMGNPLYSDDIGAMCFNAAKSWQLSWYNDNKLAIDPRQQRTWMGTMVGVADFGNNPNQYPVVIKIETGTETDQFIAFNRATGINRHNDEADNEVTVVEAGTNGEWFSQSFVKATLKSGEVYTIPKWDGAEDLTISAKAIKINTGSNPGYAEISVCLGQCVDPTEAPSASPTARPSLRGSSNRTPSAGPANYSQMGVAIHGKNTDDAFGQSLTMSKDGLRVAISGPGTNNSRGVTRVFDWDIHAQDWVQIGQDIIGTTVGGGLGWSLAMNEDGSRIVLGAPEANNDDGLMRVYELDISSAWHLLGSEIQPEVGSKGQVGVSVTISANGDRVAYGAPRTNGYKGRVKVFQLVGGQWVPMGQNIDCDEVDSDSYSGGSIAMSADGGRLVIGGRLGSFYMGYAKVYDYNVSTSQWQLNGSMNGLNYYDRFGGDVDISEDGTRIVVGAPTSSGQESDVHSAGEFQVFDYDGSNWNRLGQKIIGEVEMDRLGESVAISGDGTHLVVSSPQNDENGTNAGKVQVYKYSQENQLWLNQGSHIFGINEGERFGEGSSAVAMDRSGMHFATGARRGNYYAGTSRMYKSSLASIL